MLIGLVPCAGIANAWWDRRLGRAGSPAQAVGALRAGQALGLVAVLLLLASLVGWPIDAGWRSYAIATSLVVVNCVNAISVSFWIAMRLAADGAEEP